MGVVLFDVRMENIGCSAGPLNWFETWLHPEKEFRVSFFDWQDIKPLNLCASDRYSRVPVVRTERVCSFNKKARTNSMLVMRREEFSITITKDDGLLEFKNVRYDDPYMELVLTVEWRHYR